TAAREAAKAAAKAVAASRARSGVAHHPVSKESPRLAATPTPSPAEAESAAAEPSAAETPVVSTARSERTRKQIEQLATQFKSIDRTSLDDANAQRYDIANGLLVSARRALSKNDYMAANSLTEKARVLIQQIGH